MGYYRSKKKNNVIRILLLIVLSICFSVMAVWLVKRLPDNFATLKKVKATVAELEGQNNEAQKLLDSLNSQLNEISTKVDSLEQDVEEAKKENPDMAKAYTEGDTKNAYLTFDDGPSKNTTVILDFLKTNNIKATFFVTGKVGMDDLYKRIVDEGHTLAIHSDTHDYEAIYQTVDTFMDDINALSARIEKITGQKPTIIRFPGGSNNTISHKFGGNDIMDKIIDEVNNQGYIYYDWNVDSSDASKALQDRDVIVNSVLNGADGMKDAIILMHDAPAKTTSVEALPMIVEGLRKKGFTFKKITEDTPPIQFTVRAGE